MKANLPGQKLSASQAPKVFVSLEPAELILLRGKPNYLLVQGAKQLLWVSNTDSDVFRMGADRPGLFPRRRPMVLGARFHRPLDVRDADPASRLQADPARARAVARPGVGAGHDAGHRGRAARAGFRRPRASARPCRRPRSTYQGGAPQFQPIEKTTVQRAVNTDKDILKVGDLYYMCFQGVWFMSKTPTGPWKVTGEVPKTDLRDSGELAVARRHLRHGGGVERRRRGVCDGGGLHGRDGRVGLRRLGHGLLLPAVRRVRRHVSVLPPHYPTYGFGASYNPWTGAYTRGAVAYGPYGGAGVGQRYNPRTGTYSRGAVAYGPYGARGAASAYNPRTGAYGATRQGSNVYGSWGTTGVARGDQWATTSRYTNNVTGNTTRVTQGSEGGAAVTRNAPGAGGGAASARTEGGDVYAGRDGNVYRKEGDSWQKYDNGGWSSVDQPTPQQRQQAQDRATQGGAQARDRAATPPAGTRRPRGQVTRDSAARAEGAQRTRDSGSVRSGTSSRSGSYRPSGGSRGGAAEGAGGVADSLAFRSHHSTPCRT